MIPRPQNPLVVALDVSDLDRAESLARAVGPASGMVKVGLELFSAHGPASVVRIRAIAPVFLDLKLHDIPTTVERAARNAARLGVAMLTVHALGGEAMVAAAVRGAAQGSLEFGGAPPAILAVTVLSSMAGERIAPHRPHEAILACHDDRRDQHARCHRPGQKHAIERLRIHARGFGA